MSTVKISELPAITGVNTVATDVIPIVDVSLNTTNKITREEFFKNIPEAQIDSININGSAISSSINITLDPAAGQALVVNQPGADVDFRVESAVSVYGLYLRGSDGNIGVNQSSPSGNFHITGSSTAGADTILRLQNGNTDGVTYLAMGDSADSFIGGVFYQHTSDQLNLYANNDTRATFSSTDTVFNENGANVDFRVESDTLTHALFVQGSDGRTALGATNGPLARLDVSRLGGATPTFTGGLPANTALFVHSGAGAAGSGAEIVIGSGNAGISAISFGDTDDADIGRIIYNHASDAMSFVVNGSTALALTSGLDVEVVDKIVHSGDTNTAIRFPAADTVTVETANTERLRVTSGGLIGINNTSPDARLHVTDSATSYSWTPSASTEFILERNGDCHMTLAGSATGDSRIQFATVASESRAYMVFDRSTDIMSFVVAAQTGATINANGEVRMPEVYVDTVTGRDLYIASDGQLGYVSSTRASKTNIENLSDVSWVYQLNPVKFQYRARDAEGNYTDTPQEEIEYGLIAEEVEQVNPDLVFYDEVDGGKELRGIQYSRLISPLLKIVQQQQEHITSLEARIAAIETTTAPSATELETVISVIAADPEVQNGEAN